jgi:KDO2-lipid IV(A) lauroyltransferase
MTGSMAGLGQRILWRIEALGYDLVTAGLRLLPVDAASALGGNLLKLVGPLSGAHRTAHRNLRLAFPDMTPERRAEIVKAQWENFGRYIAEMTMMDRLTPASGRVEIVGAERLAKIAADHTPTVFVSGHLSNMEIMPSAILASGVDCVITGRALNNPFVNERLIEDRRRYGVVLFAPKGSDGTREMLQALKQGRSVALMNDQKNNQGIAAPFFGHLCHTASGPTKMALRTGGVIQPMSVQRLKGARFRVVVHDPIILAQTGDKHADVVAGVAQINAFIEARVRERPEEWFWVHRRWAKEAYDSMEAEGDSR